MNGWGVAGLVAAGVYLALLLLKGTLSIRYASRHPETRIAAGAVSILQPILGGDPFLPEALRRNLQNAPENARFIWLVDESDLTGRQATDQFLADKRVEVVSCPACPPGTNPKLFKLDLALASVTTEFVAVLDDDTMLSSEHLPRAMAALDDCDLYTGLPHYSSDGNLCSRLIAHFVNNNSILTYLPLLDWCGALTINGMFYVMRTGYLRGIGGFQPIVGQLCDDYALARLVIEKGGRIRQGTTSQVLHTSLDGPRQYLRQMHRWFLFANILVADQRLLVQAALVVFLGLPPLLLWCSFLCLCWGWPDVATLASLLVTRHLIIRTLHRRFLSPVPKFSPVLSLVSELLQPIHLMHASLSRTIVWRSRRIRVGRRGAITYVASAEG